MTDHDQDASARYMDPSPANAKRFGDGLCRLLVGSITDYGIFALDARGHVISWNPGAERIKGYREEEVLGKHVSLFYSAEDHAAGLPAHALRLAVTEGRFEHEGWRVRKDGSQFWAGVVVTALHAPDGDLLGFGKVTRDLTERRHAARRAEMLIAEQARRTEAELGQRQIAAILEGSLDAFVSIDSSGTIVEWNRQAERMFGWTRAEAMGSSVAELIVPARSREALARGLERLVRTGERRAFTRRIEATGLHREGDELPIELSISAVARERELFVHAFLRDITAQKQVQAGERRSNSIIELLQEVASTANEASTVREALERSLASTCRHTGWPLGHVYLREGDELVATDIWHMHDTAEIESFRQATRTSRFRAGFGLPGRVLDSGRPAWVADVSEDSNFLRRASAVQSGIRAAFAFPVMVGAEVVAVLEFFIQTPAEPDSAHLEVMAPIGMHLGRVVERERTAKQISEALKRYHLANLAANDPIWDWDLERDRVTWNEVAHTLFGDLPDSGQADSTWWIERVHPEDRQRVQARLQSAIDCGEEAILEEFRFRRADGAYLTVLDRGYLLRDEEGRAVRKIESMVDITPQREAEARQRFLAEMDQMLAQQIDPEQRIAALARSSVPVLADCCFVDMVGRDGEVRRVEAAHADPAKEPLARRLLDFPHVRTEFAGRARVLETGESVLLPKIPEQLLEDVAQDQECLEVVHQLGPGSCMMVPLRAHGRTLGALTLLRAASAPPYGPDDLALAEDVGDRAGLMLENALLYAEAREAVRAREDVLAVVTHDLRNPLQAVVAGTEALKAQLPTELRHRNESRYLDIVGRATDQMSRLVNDLLDVTRIASGRLAIRRYREEAAEIIDEAVEVLEPLATRRSLRLRVVVAEDLPALFADRQRVVQVLSNLVGNAIQATPEGGIITLEAKPAKRVVRFSVTDTGPGIPDEHLPHLFDRFWQGRYAGRGNAGLGLAIAKAIIEAHGGRISAESRPGGGSTFSFTVPAAAADTPDGPGRWDGDDADEAVAQLAPAGEGGQGPARSEPPREDQPGRPGGTAAFVPLLHSRTPSHGEAAHPPTALADALREDIVHAVHHGHLRAGDRLKSIREVAREFAVTAHAAVQAYDALSAEGLVEKRGRSGVYVAPQEASPADLRADTTQWFAGVLAGACAHQIRIPRLQRLLRRWTASARLRCACIDSDADCRTAFCDEVQRQFGLDSTPIDYEGLPPCEPGQRVNVNRLPPEVTRADVLLTTVFHAAAVRAIAEALDKPVIVATANPESVAAIECHLRDGPLTVVCTDPVFADRVRGLRGGVYRDRIQVVFADDAEAVARLDRSEPVLVTLAAHQRLAPVDLRLLVLHSRPFSPAFERSLSETIIQLNLETAPGSV